MRYYEFILDEKWHSMSPAHIQTNRPEILIQLSSIQYIQSHPKGTHIFLTNSSHVVSQSYEFVSNLLKNQK